MALKMNCPDICIYICIYTPWKWTCLPKRDHFKKEVLFEPWTDHHFVRYFSFQGGICYNQSFSLSKKMGVAQTKIATANFLTPKKFLTPKFSDPKRDPTFPLRTQKNQGCQICLLHLHISGNIWAHRWYQARSKIQSFPGFGCEGQTYNQTYNQPLRGQKSPHHLTLLIGLSDPARGGISLWLVNRVPGLAGFINHWFAPFFLRPAIKPVFLRGKYVAPGGGVGWPAMMSGHPNSTHGSCERQRATRCSGRLGCFWLEDVWRRSCHQCAILPLMFSFLRVGRRGWSVWHQDRCLTCNSNGGYVEVLQFEEMFTLR